MIDLHTHSTASDGRLSPSELIEASCRAGLEAVALTDHDTVSGLAEFMAAGRHRGVTAVPGVEIACSWYGLSLHLVGLFVDYENVVLLELLSSIRRHREERNRQILRNLQKLGIPLTDAAVQAESQGCESTVIGRLHFARALVNGGYCLDLQQAFSRYLGSQAAAYVRRFLPLPGPAIETMHRAGGVVVLAHPLGGGGRIQRGRLRQKMQRLVSLGLDAVEVRYSDYDQPRQQIASELADEFGLLPSGGSDFHGEHSSSIRLGRGYGNLVVPGEWLAPLRERALFHTSLN